MDGPLLHQVLFSHGRNVMEVDRPSQKVLVHFAKPGRHRGHDRFDPLGQAFPRLDEPLQHELTGEIDVHMVLEHDRDLGEPKFRQRSYLG